MTARVSRQQQGEAKAPVNGARSLDALFRPDSVAIIGASSDPKKIGGRPINHLKRGNFPGAIYPINPQPEVQGRFEAIAWTNGPDGAPGTADDLRIGPVKAQWSVAPWNEKAAKDRDIEFAGSIDKDSGIFAPAAAGPNPARKQSTNNAGNLKVIATVGEGESAVRGEGQLLVTVQRWINPPLW